jgi:hypothetical protein
MKLRDLSMNVPAVVSVIGGHAAQDILRGISHVGYPINNFMLFDGLRSIGHVFTFGR